MDNWQFALIVLGFGTGLAIFIDRMLARTRGRECGKQPPTEQQQEKKKWLTFWFSGKFPSAEEEKAEKRECKEVEAEKKGS